MSLFAESSIKSPFGLRNCGIAFTMLSHHIIIINVRAVWPEKLLKLFENYRVSWVSANDMFNKRINVSRSVALFAVGICQECNRLPETMRTFCIIRTKLNRAQVNNFYNFINSINYKLACVLCQIKNSPEILYKILWNVLKNCFNLAEI